MMSRSTRRPRARSWCLSVDFVIGSWRLVEVQRSRELSLKPIQRAACPARPHSIAEPQRCGSNTGVVAADLPGMVANQIDTHAADEDDCREFAWRIRDSLGYPHAIDDDQLLDRLARALSTHAGDDVDADPDRMVLRPTSSLIGDPVGH